jgi:hypothetical protein
MVSKYEIKAKKELVASGWLVDDKRGMGRWSKNRDFFNAFDLVAYKPRQLRYIAIKGREGVPSKLRLLIGSLNFPSGVTREIWTYNRDRKAGPVRKEILGD